jgi:hypothetical protein
VRVNPIQQHCVFYFNRKKALKNRITPAAEKGILKKKKTLLESHLHHAHAEKKEKKRDLNLNASAAIIHQSKVF